MKKALLMMGPLQAAQTKQLEDRFTLHKLWQADNPENLLNQVRNDVCGMVSVYGVNVSARLISALPHLEIISHFGVGYDNIDVQAAKEQGVIVTNTPDVLTDDTADLGMALILSVCRRVVEGDIYVRSGQWSKKGALPLGRSLRGKTLGIVGFGRIGRAVARRAEAFGMKVIYTGPRAKSDVADPYFPSLIDMASQSDVLMITCPYREDTHHLINARVFKALGKNGIVVNIARGKVVHEQDMVDALENGIIAGAGLDVFEHEPDVPAALCRLDNVVLQPHQGSATTETRTAMAQMVVDNLRLYFDKAEVLTPV